MCLLAVCLLVCFVCPKERNCETRKKCFLFHFESSFRSWNNQILNFQIFKCDDVIKCLSIKHKTHFTELLGTETQLDNEIWPVYVALEDNFFIIKFYGRCGLETSSRPFLIFKELSVKRNLLIWANFDSFAITYQMWIQRGARGASPPLPPPLRYNKHQN